MGLLRYGTTDPSWPQGWQFDIEGSAQVRLDPDENLDLRSVDYRVGTPLTYAYGRHRLKLGYYHLCSHLGDEFLAAHPTFHASQFRPRRLDAGLRLLRYRKSAAVWRNGLCVSGRREQGMGIQFGFDYSPRRPTGIRGAPFFAVNGHFREELNYSGNFVLQAGWAWRADEPSAAHGLPLLQRPQRPILVLSQFRAADRRRHVVRLLANLRLPRLPQQM